MSFPKQLACRGPGVRILRPMSVREKRHSAAEHVLLLFTLLGDTYPQKYSVKFTCLRNCCVLAETCSTFSGSGLPDASARRGGEGTPKMGGRGVPPKWEEGVAPKWAEGGHTPRL